MENYARLSSVIETEGRNYNNTSSHVIEFVNKLVYLKISYITLTVLSIIWKKI